MAKRFWADWKGAIVAFLALLAATLVGLASLLSLIAPLNPVVWLVLAGALIIGLFWQAIKPQHELNALRDVRARINQLQRYDKMEIRTYRFPWTEAERRLGVAGQSTTRIGLRVENVGDATIVSCSLRMMESHFKDPVGAHLPGYPTINEWVDDPVGTQNLRFEPQQPLPNNPAYSNIAHSGGFAIFEFARTTPQQIGLYYVFVGQLSDRRLMEGLYCVRLQLEGTIRRGGDETELTPQQFLVIFNYRARFLRLAPKIIKIGIRKG